MQGAADGCSQDLRLISLDGIDLGNLRDELQTIPAAVVDAADEGRNIVGARLCRQDGLTRRETKRTVRLDAVVGKPFQRLDTFLDHRHLYHNVRMDGVQLLAFLDNSLEFGR